MGSIMGSEITQPPFPQNWTGSSRPFAMLPFSGYHISDYLQHWLNIGKMTDADKLPKLFYVNWFQR